MRLFQRMQRTESADQEEALKRDLKRDYGILIERDLRQSSQGRLIRPYQHLQRTSMSN